MEGHLYPLKSFVPRQLGGVVALVCRSHSHAATFGIQTDPDRVIAGNIQGWKSANGTLSRQDPPKPSLPYSLALHFDNGVNAVAAVDANCSVAVFDSTVSTPWCRETNPSCKRPPEPAPFSPTSPTARFWGGKGAEVVLMEMSHSDIYWLGTQVGSSGTSR